VRRLVVVTNGVFLATEQPQQILFWDGHSRTPSVIAAVVCWLIDAGTTRSAANPGPAPVAEMRASV